jgi:rod shape-determining protein MreD
MISLIKYTIQFVLLVAFQVLVLNNIEIFGYMNPYLYIIFILTLPSDINRNLLLILGFILGFCIDIFENSGAVHASATMLVAFLRPYLFRLMAGPANVEIDRMNIQTLGPVRFMVLASISVFVHHFWLFSLEAFHLSELLQVIQRTFFSGIFTLLLIYLAQLLVYRKPE